MTDDAGWPIAELSGLVPSDLPQTAQAAEFCAVDNSLAVLQKDTHGFEDCQAVQGAVQRQLMDNTAAKRSVGNGAYAGIIKNMVRQSQWKWLKSTTKVKAHRELGSARDDYDRFLIRGNDAADRAAKDAVLRHPQALADSERPALQAHRKAARLLKLAVKLLPLWPKLEKAARRGRTGATPAPPLNEGEGGAAPTVDEDAAREAVEEGGRILLEPQEAHEWANIGPYHQRCSRCWQLPTETHTQECKGMPAFAARLALQPLGHRWFRLYTEPARDLLICAACGAWTGARVYGKARLACRPPTEWGSKTLRRIAAGKHPNPSDGAKLATSTWGHACLGVLASAADLTYLAQRGATALVARQRTGGSTCSFLCDSSGCHQRCTESRGHDPRNGHRCCGCEAQGEGATPVAHVVASEATDWDALRVGRLKNLAAAAVAGFFWGGGATP